MSESVMNINDLPAFLVKIIPTEKVRVKAEMKSQN